MKHWQLATKPAFLSCVILMKYLCLTDFSKISCWWNDRFARICLAVLSWRYHSSAVPAVRKWGEAGPAARAGQAQPRLAKGKGGNGINHRKQMRCLIPPDSPWSFRETWKKGRFMALGTYLYFASNSFLTKHFTKYQNLMYIKKLQNITLALLLQTTFVRDSS